MSAEFVDALKGYEYFLGQRGKASISQINQYLISVGRKQIKQRTYNHYIKLLAHGFRHYVPINKFDVFQSLGRLQLVADRRRYSRNFVEIPVKVSRDGIKWNDGIVIDRSLVGLGLIIPGAFSITPGSQLFIHLEGYNDVPVIIVWRKYSEKGTELGTRAYEFIAKYQISAKQIDEQRLRGQLQIIRHEEGTLQWEELYRIIVKANELLSSTDDLIYSIDDVLKTNIRLAQPVLIIIKFGSPGETQIKLDFGVAEIIKIVIEKIQFWGLEKRKLTAEIEQLELNNTIQKLEIARKAINIGKEASDLGISDELIKSLLVPIKNTFDMRELPHELFEPGSLERSILEKRIVPAAAELVAGDDPDYDVNATTK